MVSYSDPVENDTNGWIDLKVEQTQSRDGTEVPFKLFANRFKSSSQDCGDFIHDPLAVMRDAPELQGLGIDDTWKVTTFILNHHNTLSATHLHAMAAVNSEQQTIGLTLVKKQGS